MSRFRPCLIALFPLLACSATEPRPGDSIPSVLAIAVETVGHSQDPNGYQIRVNGLSAGSVSVEDTLFLDALEPGEHAIELADVAPNCGVQPAPPLRVQLTKSGTTYARFAVGCDSVLSGVILFTRLVPGPQGQPGSSEIFHIRPDGSGVSRVAAGSRATSSPDGRQIVFHRYGVVRSIFRMNVDGTHLVDLTPATSEDQCPVWSPDGSLIAFSSKRSGQWQLHVMDPEGRNQRRLTFSDRQEACGVSWSPDGARLAVGRSLPDDSGSEIFIVNVDGTGEVKLSRNSQDGDGSPVWAPDGARILFNSTRSSTNQLWIMQADGQSPQNLTNADEFYHGDAVWSPDGQNIVYSRSGDYLTLFRMESDGTGIVPLTSGNVYDTPSQWLP